MQVTMRHYRGIKPPSSLLSDLSSTVNWIGMNGLQKLETTDTLEQSHRPIKNELFLFSRDLYFLCI